MGLSASADIDENYKAIEVRFPYSVEAVENIKTVPGARWNPKLKAWLLPADLVTCRRLREAYGEWLDISEDLIWWAEEELKAERAALKIKHTGGRELIHIKIEMENLYNWLRPYQREDIAFMKDHNCINANQPGLGKTIETIAALIEAGMVDDHLHLICAPATSLRLVWEAEIKRWLPDASIALWHGGMSAKERALSQRKAVESFGQGTWVITTPSMIREGRFPQSDNKKLVWDSFIVDEFHKSGLCNGQSEFNKVARRIKAKRRFALSGTPMGGQPIKLWGALNFLDPRKFSSRWNWAEQWLQIESNGFGRDIKGVAPGRQDEFDKHLATYMVRRTKDEVVKELPPKQYINVWCYMTPKQTKQYGTFRDQLQVMIGDEKVSAVGVLAEMTRLKQFANALCEVDDNGNIAPTEDCPKLEHLLERLEERGISKKDSAGDEVAVVASESKRMIEMVSKWLNKKGISTELITGDTKHEDRQRIVEQFQSGHKNAPRVICLTTTAGGVAITLDRADSVHILDETWNPDDQEQLEDRVHRVSRLHQVTIYYYRTKETIQESIWKVNINKRVTNKEILSLARKL